MGAQDLPEGRQFIGVLAGCCVIVGLFLWAFVMLTVIKAAVAPHDVTAAWFAAWGSWARDWPRRACSSLPPGASELPARMHAPIAGKRRWSARSRTWHRLVC